MFKSQTVFIVGAGASFEAEMPLGSQLTGEIAKLVALEVQYGGHVTKGDQLIYNALRENVEKQQRANNNLIASARNVAEAMELALSIDTFLESHTHNAEFIEIGKLGIARAISKAEQRSKMRPGPNDQPFKISELADTWYYSLVRQLFTGISAQNPKYSFNNVSFIVFNYDRLIQVFLKRALETYFRITTHQSDDILRQVKFLHPYGSLGSIFEGSSEFLPFAYDRSNLNDVASRIKTFSESTNLKEEILGEIERADTLIYLGFGFHDQNMKLFDVAKRGSRPTPKRVFATTKGLSQSDESVVKSQISFMLWGSPEPPDGQSTISTNSGTCAELFSTYWRSLTS